MQVHLIFKNHKKQTSRFQTNGEGVRKKNLKKKKKTKDTSSKAMDRIKTALSLSPTADKA